MYEVYVDVFTDHKSLQYVFIQNELKLRQIRWLELLKHYDMNVFYHHDKVTVVSDALSCMIMGSVSPMKQRMT